MATILDSEAAFCARAKLFGVPDLQIAALKARKVASFGAFAWVAPYHPQNQDDTLLKTSLTDLLGAEPSSGDMAFYRRLHFEASTMTISEAKLRIERADGETVVRKLPGPERAARHASQKARLPDLIWTSTLEPSYNLLDKIQSQIEDNLGAYVSLEFCTSRSDEADSIKKLADPASLSEHVLRMAFRRRALAYDQSNLIAYRVMEQWTEKLYTAMANPVPKGWSHVTKSQILVADKQLFLRILDDCRAGVVPTTDLAGTLVRPLEVAMQAVWDSSSITVFFAPLQGHSEFTGIDREMAGEKPSKVAKVSMKSSDSKNGDGKSKRHKGEGKGKGGKSKLPKELAGCWTHIHGAKACQWYNLDRCKSEHTQPGEKCNVGIHLCMGKACGGTHPYSKCPNKKKE